MHTKDEQEVMTPNLPLLLAALALGIMLGAGIAYHEFTGTVGAAADDGTPIIIEGRYYSIAEIAPPTCYLTHYSINTTWQT